MNMRIGHINYSYRPIIGGEDVYLATLVEGLRRNGFSQRIYQRRTGERGPDVVGVLAPRLPLIRRQPLYTFNLFLNWHFPQLRRERCLIVHDPFHFWPVRWHQRTIVISQGVRWDRPAAQDRWYNWIRHRAAKTAWRHAHQLVANDSHFFRQFGVSLKPGERLFSEITPRRWFIPNCIDGRRFEPGDGIASLRRLNPVLVPRRVVPARGIHLAIEAFSIFRQEFPETSLVVAGDFQDDHYRRHVFTLIERHRLTGCVYFLGAVNWQTIPQVYRSALISVIPTLYEEGTSLAALESMACGTATVSTNVGGLADLPTYQCRPDATALAHAMAECYQNRQQIAAKQRSAVLENFNLERFTAAWLNVISAATI